MAKPNKSARGSGASEAARRGRNERVAADPMMQDMAAFQRGDMSAEDFRAKWERA